MFPAYFFAPRPRIPPPWRHRDRVAQSRRPGADGTGALHRYTYRDAHKRARQLAQALARLGVKEGDRVGTLAWNGYRHFEAFYGISGMGAVMHTVNPRLFAEQLVYIVNHAKTATCCST